LTDRGSTVFQVLAATQTPGSEGKRWFQGTADAVRQFDWLFDVRVRFDAFFFMTVQTCPYGVSLVSNTQSSYKKPEAKENILLLA